MIVCVYIPLYNYRPQKTFLNSCIGCTVIRVINALLNYYWNIIACLNSVETRNRHVFRMSEHAKYFLIIMQTPVLLAFLAAVVWISPITNGNNGGCYGNRILINKYNFLRRLSSYRDGCSYCIPREVRGEGRGRRGWRAGGESKQQEKEIHQEAEVRSTHVADRCHVLQPSTEKHGTCQLGEKQRSSMFFTFCNCSFPFPDCPSWLSTSQTASMTVVSYTRQHHWCNIHV